MSIRIPHEMAHEMARRRAGCAISGPKGPVKMAQYAPVLPEMARFMAREMAHRTRRLTMPGLLDKAVARVKSRGVKASSAYPIAVASLQKAGDLAKGSLRPTAKGKARNRMTPAQRAKTRG